MRDKDRSLTVAAPIAAVCIIQSRDRHRRAVLAWSAMSRARPRSFTSRASSRMDSRVMTRPVPFAIFPLYPPFLATNSSRPKMTIGISAMHT